MESLLENKKELKNIEEQILGLMNEGNIMGDEKLVDTLGVSRSTVNEIKQRIEEASVAEKEIEAARTRYKAVAYRFILLFHR